MVRRPNSRLLARRGIGVSHVARIAPPKTALRQSARALLLRKKGRSRAYRAPPKTAHSGWIYVLFSKLRAKMGCHDQQLPDGSPHADSTLNFSNQLNQGGPVSFSTAIKIRECAGLPSAPSRLSRFPARPYSTATAPQRQQHIPPDRPDSRGGDTVQDRAAMLLAKL